MNPVITAAAVFLMLAAGAAAEGPKGPCRADVQKFCKDVEPGGGRLIACLKTHEAELSADCKAKGLAAKEAREGREAKGPAADKRNALREACKADAEKLCADAKGPGEKMRCLKENEAALSEGCKTKLKEGGERMKKANPCLADIEKFCKDVKPGEGRIMDCLKTHDAELSAQCKAKRPGKKDMEPGREAKGQKEERPNVFREACKDDLKTLCAGTTGGRGEKLRCLKSNEAKLSEGCKAGLAKAKEMMDQRREARKGPRGGLEPGGAPAAPEAQSAPEQQQPAAQTPALPPATQTPAEGN